MMTRRARLLMSVVVLVLSTQGMAFAQRCGSTVTGMMTLNESLRCPTGHGLVVGNGATLNCAGHTITGGDQTGQYGVYVRDVSNATVQNCVVRNFEIGIRLRGATNSTVQDSDVLNNTRYGIDLTQSSTGVLIQGNTISGNNDEGIHVSGSHSNTLANNTVVNNAVEGIYLLSSHDNDVIGNTIQDHGTAGIYIKSSNGNYIDGNTLDNDPIQLVSGSQLNILANNMINGQRIKFDGAPNNEVYNMSVLGSSSDAYYFFNSPGNKVIDSQASNPAGYHIKAASGSSALVFQRFSFNAPLRCSVDSSSGVTVTNPEGQPVACGPK
jgi:parallel beta-helix repeat protein